MEVLGRVASSGAVRKCMRTHAFILLKVKRDPRGETFALELNFHFNSNCTKLRSFTSSLEIILQFKRVDEEIELNVEGKWIGSLPIYEIPCKFNFANVFAVKPSTMAKQAKKCTRNSAGSWQQIQFTLTRKRRRCWFLFQFLYDEPFSFNVNVVVNPTQEINQTLPSLLQLKLSWVKPHWGEFEIASTQSVEGTKILMAKLIIRTTNLTCHPSFHSPA